jgi:hypothetical protein
MWEGGHTPQKGNYPLAPAFNPSSAITICRSKVTASFAPRQLCHRA